MKDRPMRLPTADIPAPLMTAIPLHLWIPTVDTLTLTGVDTGVGAGVAVAAEDMVGEELMVLSRILNLLAREIVTMTGKGVYSPHSSLLLSYCRTKCAEYTELNLSCMSWITVNWKMIATKKDRNFDSTSLLVYYFCCKINANSSK